MSDCPTADMPNGGSATYNGNWVATVRAADGDGEGAITLEHGVASLMANFGDEVITADLMDLAKLEGTIDRQRVLRDQGNRGS